MAKKRATMEEAPQRERRSKYAEDVVVSAPVLASTRGKKAPKRGRGGPSTSRDLPTTSRELVPEQPSPVSMGRFANRPVCFEGFVDKKMIPENPMLASLLEVGWDPVLTPYSSADAEMVRRFYSSIRNPCQQPLGFDVLIGDRLMHVDVDVVERVSGVLKGKIVVLENDVKRRRFRDDRTTFVCGELKLWEQKNSCLKASKMLLEFRLLHRIFISNLYPRVGNRTEVSQYMLEVLYRVGKGESLCFPSMVIRHILTVAAPSNHTKSLAFGRLVCKIARHFGLRSGPHVQFEPRIVIGPIKIGSIDPNEPPSERVGRERGRQETEDGSDEGIEEEFLSPLNITERLDSMQEGLTRVEERQKHLEKKVNKMYRMMKSLFRCLQAEGAPPLSPDSQDQ